MRIGILFGGNSREREVSFAGGRTVYDNLDKSFYTAVPIFIDPQLKAYILDWPNIYKGSIRDFYPAHTEADTIGVPIALEALKDHIDFAFLTLHGLNGEDGRIQGLLEWLGIPYSGSGIFSSALGMDKGLQKKWMKAAGFPIPAYVSISLAQWNQTGRLDLFNQCKKAVGLPMVLKSAHQGSSIGVSILKEDSLTEFIRGMNQSFFLETVTARQWLEGNQRQLVQHLADYREGPGLPMRVEGSLIDTESALWEIFNQSFNRQDRPEALLVQGIDSENTVLVEAFIVGKEFSCIVIEDIDGTPIALPPTEIRAQQVFYDYRSKYLPGIAHKITPIEASDAQIEAIASRCEALYTQLGFGVYARIDGFLTSQHEIFLNDPNTTSGMMPSSFFFHQAAEIGLNPSQFLSYIIQTSLQVRLRESTHAYFLTEMIDRQENLRQINSRKAIKKSKIGVLLGGFSSERHISVESGRNIYEKLSASVEYEPIPLFLLGEPGQYEFYKIPISLLLKDNADDIADRIRHFIVHPAVGRILEKSKNVIDRYVGGLATFPPEQWTFDRMQEELDFVFIALHGRPGEDGEIQGQLERRGIAFNGSGSASSRLTIDKFETNEWLRKNGILVPHHSLVRKEDWTDNPARVLEVIHREFSYPFIAKPSDDGCSSAVVKIKSQAEFHAYADILFRNEIQSPVASVETLGLDPREEFPMKQVILVEELIERKQALVFMEITGGVWTHINDRREIVYEVFEPSEALAGHEILSLEEKFLAGGGQNITPPRYSHLTGEQAIIALEVRTTLEKTARLLGITGYCRIDAFVRIYAGPRAEVIIIEANSLPGMTPATAIFHQAAYAGYKPFEFIQKIVEFGTQASAGNRPLADGISGIGIER